MFLFRKKEDARIRNQGKGRSCWSRAIYLFIYFVLYFFFLVLEIKHCILIIHLG